MSSFYEQFMQDLADDIIVAKQLLQLLIDEKKLLDERKHFGLEETTNKKLALMQELSDKEAKRQTLLAKHNVDSLPVKDFVFSQVPAGLDPKQDMANWNEYHALMVECRKKHEINSRIIVKANEQISRVISLLLGKQQITYDQKGQQSQNRSPKIISKA